MCLRLYAINWTLTFMGLLKKTHPLRRHIQEILYTINSAFPFFGGGRVLYNNWKKIDHVNTTTIKNVVFCEVMLLCAHFAGNLLLGFFCIRYGVPQCGNIAAAATKHTFHFFCCNLNGPFDCYTNCAVAIYIRPSSCLCNRTPPVSWKVFLTNFFLSDRQSDFYSLCIFINWWHTHIFQKCPFLIMHI